jgi:glycerol-3-phosphate dehydrogenase
MRFATYRFEDWKILQTDTKLEADICQHLYRTYGSNATKVADKATQNPEWRARIVPDYPFILAEAAYCAESEMACTLRDFLARRLRLETQNWEAVLQAIPRVAAAMGTILQWSAEVQQQQEDAYRNLVQHWQKVSHQTIA